MPIFEYECGKCGNIFEVIEGASVSQKIVDTTCNKCNSNETRRLLSIPNTVKTMPLHTLDKPISAAHYKDITSRVYDTSSKQSVRRKPGEKVINGTVTR